MFDPTTSSPDAGTDPNRFSAIRTVWDEVARAHASAGGAEARNRLFATYHAAAHRYLRAVARDPDVADDLFQEFALRFIRGDFRGADPGKGRFRSLLKAALRNLVADHHRRAARAPEGLADPDAAPASGPEDGYDEAWRACLLAEAWQRLRREEDGGGQPFYTALAFRARHQEASSEELAAELSAKVGRAVDAGWARKRLHYARVRFAELLVAVVADGLTGPATNPTVLADELIAVGLYEFCREAATRFEPPHQ